MIDVKKEAMEWLGTLRPERCRPAFKVWNPRTERELEFYYKYTTSLLIEDAHHPVPDEVKNFQGRVLEFGGGAGNVAFYLAQKGCEVDYLDINYFQKDFVRDTRDKYAITTLNIVEQPSGMYDYIILRDVIEHLPNYPETMIFLLSFLRRQGKVWIKPEFATQALPDGQMSFHFKDIEGEGGFVSFMTKFGFERTGENLWEMKKQ